MKRRVCQIQLFENIRPRPRIRRRRNGETRHVRKDLFQPPERAIIRPEVMPPLADAVRFINSDQRDVQLPQRVHEATRKPFG